MADTKKFPPFCVYKLPETSQRNLGTCEIGTASHLSTLTTAQADACGQKASQQSALQSVKLNSRSMCKGLSLCRVEGGGCEEPKGPPPDCGPNSHPAQFAQAQDEHVHSFDVFAKSESGHLTQVGSPDQILVHPLVPHENHNKSLASN